MVKKVGKLFSKFKSGATSGSGNSGNPGNRSNGVLKQGHAMRIIFFYPGEEGTYVDNAEVTLFENGIIHIKSNQEETTTHLQNCEILWTFETDAEERSNKVRLLKPAREARIADLESNLEPRPDPV